MIFMVASGILDGDIDPAQLTQALAKGARDMGAKIIRFVLLQALNMLTVNGKSPHQMGKYVLNM